MGVSVFSKYWFAGMIAIAIAPASMTAYASELPQYPFIHAKGSAYLIVAPDMGEIDFDIHAEDAEPDAVVAAVRSRIEEVTQLLAGQGVSADDFEVRSVAKSMTKAVKGEGQIDVYVVKCAVHIVVRDLRKWRDILSPLLSKPNIDGLEVTFGTTDRAKVTHQLIAGAIKDAQDSAEAMASGFGKHVGPVTAVTTGELKNLSASIGLVPGDLYFKDAEHGSGQSASGGPDALLNIAVLKMAQSVDVIFRVK
jgi:uncharacterized protein YggE